MIDDEKANCLELKFGTIKGWALHTEKAQELLRAYTKLGMSLDTLSQRDTPEQVVLICAIIDECDRIWLDWTNEQPTKEEAKRYVREYRRPKPRNRA